ncbi:hypothetical protein AAF712_002330 [Marasmius tenuissimus]|uniref:Uncharacterized protein n=1 Tax=Marasmius tenuissimus TaxID=585030 RepID=A0ABR3A9W8_9AGAR
MSKAILYLLFTILLLGLMASSAPIPGSASKKSLKQLKLKRGDPSPLKRDDAKPPKPSASAFWVIDYIPPQPSLVATKRDDVAPPKPSKGWRK